MLPTPLQIKPKGINQKEPNLRSFHAPVQLLLSLYINHLPTPALQLF